ncbi:MAG: ATP-binding protein [bacterium]
MKIAVTGKGGVGKTTIAALLAKIAVRHGNRVIAIDADPDANLAATLGHPDPDGITALSQKKDLIEERVGSGGFIRLNPRVDDLVDTLGVDVDGVKLMVLGTIPKGGGGCFCSASALLKAFMIHVLIQPNEWVILDMEAGLEHLGRGSSQGVDGLIIVLEPSNRSIETGERIERLAKDLGIKRVWGIANKLASDGDAKIIEEKLRPIPLLGAIPYTSSLGGFSAKVDLEALDPQVMERVEKIYNAITSTVEAPR